MKYLLLPILLALSGCSIFAPGAKVDPAAAQAACKAHADQAGCEADATCAWGPRPSDQVLRCYAK